MPGLLCALLLLSSISVATGASCACSSVLIPVHVDVLVPKDPTDAFAGLKSNAGSLRRVDDTYDVYDVPLQLLVHGITYTSQYWSPPVEEFQNYSYAAFSCSRGLPSLAVDWVGVGLSTRPVNASDVQYPTVAGALSQLARHLKSTSVVPGVEPFKKIIGVGHSAGSALLNFGAIVEGAQSPFDGLILTASLIVEPGAVPPGANFSSARDIDPLRWGTLDPAYITDTNRTVFYPADPTAFSSRMLRFDGFTMDVATVSAFLQTATTSLTTHYTGPVAKVLGSDDQLFCGTGRCVDVAALTAAEKVLWADARSFEVVVEKGSGHDLNLDFLAEGPFNTFVGLVEQFSEF
ncbi:Alpha/beta hydrolase family-domain-containing protein [Mycena vulgaris]|nr:Alpha/beta hydrolase family-domain-containing protein [Mycena vulgaris]